MGVCSMIALMLLFTFIAQWCPLGSAVHIIAATYRQSPVITFRPRLYITQNVLGAEGTFAVHPSLLDYIIFRTRMAITIDSMVSVIPLTTLSNLQSLEQSFTYSAQRRHLHKKIHLWSYQSFCLESGVAHGPVHLVCRVHQYLIDHNVFRRFQSIMSTPPRKQ